MLALQQVYLTTAEGSVSFGKPLLVAAMKSAIATDTRANFNVELRPSESRQRDLVSDRLEYEFDIHVECDVLGTAADVGADHTRAFLQLHQQRGRRP